MASKARELANLGNAYSDGALSNRNRVINGAQVIDQRNAGAAVTNSFDYVTDRFLALNNLASGTFTAQQSSDAPQGFTKSLKYTSTSSVAPTGTEQAGLRQYVEGFNTADLNWGTSDAQPVTLSFWVKSSLTGLFGGALVNDAFDRIYVYSYTINAANTWEYKTVTIVGDTTGTWETGNSSGIRIIWGLGAADFKKAAGSWGAPPFAMMPTGSVNLVETNGATFYLTGVQLEVGDTATPFEHRSYGQELALCQRYYQLVASASGCCANTTIAQVCEAFQPEMRASPSISIYDANGATVARITDHYASDYTTTSPVLYAENVSKGGFRVGIGGFSGLTSGRFVSLLSTNSNSAPLRFDAEL